MKDFVIKSLNGMALGLFSSLIVGLILKQLGLLLNLDFLVYIGSISQLLMGGAIGVGISYTLGFPILIIISSLIVGMYGAGSLVYLDNQVFIKLGEPIGAGVSVLVGNKIWFNTATFSNNFSWLFDCKDIFSIYIRNYLWNRIASKQNYWTKTCFYGINYFSNNGNNLNFTN